MFDGAESDPKVLSSDVSSDSAAKDTIPETMNGGMSKSDIGRFKDDCIIFRMAFGAVEE